MKKNNKWPLFTAIIVVIFLGWWILVPTAIEVKEFNKSPIAADDPNLNILPGAKQIKVYSNLIIIRVPFRGKEYVTAYPEDAVTVTESKTEVMARVYTNNPDTARVKSYVR